MRKAIAMVFFFASAGVQADLLSQMRQECHRALMTENYPIAQKVCPVLADQGDVNALYGLGNMYRYGLDANQNTFQAVRYFAKAMRMNHAPSALALGQVCEFSPDYCAEGSAIAGYEKAVELGLTEAEEGLERLQVDNAPPAQNTPTASRI